MIKSIFFPVLNDAVSEAGLDTACELARTHGAQVVAAVCTNPISPVALSSEYYPMDIYRAFSDAARATQATLKAELEKRLASAGVGHQVHAADSVMMSASEMAGVHARYFDLIVFGRLPGGETPLERDQFAALLLHSGRPVLVVPAGNSACLDEGAVVAWKPTREASRAVHDALPLLQRAGSVRVVVVNPAVGDVEHGELPGADIGAHLAHHGLKVEVVQCPRGEDSTGASILREVREQGAGLLVAGGYGHRRLREYVFGGVTRTLFDQAVRPVFFSH